MSIFTNPASGSVEHAKAYTAGILGLLGQRDPRGVLEETPAALRRAIEGLSETQRAEPEAPGKWSVRQVVRHLADSELVWGYRIRMVLAEDRPRLTGYDQDAWAERLRYDESDVAESLEVFALLRRVNLRLIAGLRESDLQRVCLHSERGEESLDFMIRLDAGHDLLHLRQIERIRAAVTQRSKAT
jgi:hypothetical protein